MVPVPTFLQNLVSQSDWDRLLALWCAYTKRLVKGQTLVAEGDAVENVYIVLEGALELSATDYWGNLSLLGRVEQGNLFGLAYAFGRSQTYMVSVQAAMDSVVLAIPYANMEASIDTHGRLVYPVYRGWLAALSNRSLALVGTIGQVKQRTVRQKVLAYLSFLAREQGNNRVVCPLDRQQMADYLAVDRAALSRELSALQKEGLLTYRKNIFVLKMA